MDSEEQNEGFGVEGVGGWASLVVGIKEGMYCVEHWVKCIFNNEFWNTHTHTQNKIKKEIYIYKLHSAPSLL